MNPDPLRSLRHRLRQHRLTLIAEVCRYTGVETGQQLTETPLVNAKAHPKTESALPPEAAKNNREVIG